MEISQGVELDVIHISGFGKLVLGAEVIIVKVTKLVHEQFLLGEGVLVLLS